MENLTKRKCGSFHAEALMIPCYVQCWPFNGDYCSACGEVGVDWGPVKQFAFDALVGWWWQGAVLVSGQPPN